MSSGPPGPKLGGRASGLRRYTERRISEIKGKVVAITGASSGIGEAAALLLAARGAKVVLGARGPERLQALAARIPRLAGKPPMRARTCGGADDLTRLAALACERYGRLDVLVSNAGVGPISPLDDLRVEEWEEMVDVNVKGLLYGIAAALPVFRRQGNGHFVNLASTAGHKTVANQAGYSGTKFAVRAISEGLRIEAGPALRVVVVSPGFVRIDFVQAVSNPETRAQLIQARDAMAIPPDAVARAIAYAIEQPHDVDVGEIVVRPTAQG